MRMLNRGRAIAVALGIALSAGFATSAPATVYTITSAQVDSDPGGLKGNIYFSGLGNGAGYETAMIGRLSLKGTTELGQAIDLSTYCIDIFDTLAPGTFTPTTAVNLALDPIKLTAMTTFLAHADPLVTSATASAAAQLGAWEIMNESSGRWDVASGAFKAAGSALGNRTSGAISLANQWLGELASNNWGPVANVQIGLLDAPGNQAQAFVLTTESIDVAPPSVPEPGTWALTVFGFGSLGYGLRRRREKPIPSL